MKIFKSPIFWGVYAYTLTILAQYGFNSYFGIPGNLIEPSIRDNIIFFFIIFKGLIGSPVIWVILFLLFIIAIVILFFCHLPDILIKIFIIFLIIFSIPLFYNFGGVLAKQDKIFPVFSGGCFNEKDNLIYIIPAYYQTSAIVVPISSDDSRKIVGSFFLKEPIDPECEIHNEKIGQVTK